jgi:hypothetical protein
VTGRDRWLWIGVVAGPIAWFADLTLSYVACPGPRRAGPVALLLAISAAAFLLAAAGGLIGWRSLGPASHSHRARFLAEASLALSVLAMLLVVAMAIPTVMLIPGGEP